MKRYIVPPQHRSELICAAIYHKMNQQMTYRVINDQDVFMPHTRAAELWLMMNVPVGTVSEEVSGGPPKR